jgi:hypothetical protein
MTEQEWLAGTDPGPMIEAIREKASQRKLRLFGTHCARHIWRKMPLERTDTDTSNADNQDGKNYHPSSPGHRHHQPVQSLTQR